MYKKIIRTGTSKATIIIRIMTGVVFLSEGIQKFLFPALRGAGRFESMGFPYPDYFATAVGLFEIVGGLFLLAGFITRGAAIVMLVNMTVAIVVTKIPIALGESFGPFILRSLKTYGFWSMLHEMRTDLAMWLGSLFLFIKGGGFWSLDLEMFKTRQKKVKEVYIKW